MKKDILMKISKIEKLIQSLRADIEKITDDFYITEKAGKSSEAELTAGNDIDFTELYNILYQAYVGDDYEVIKRFVDENTKKVLKAFCKHNYLPIDVNKTSKPRIVEELLQLMKQSAIIRR